MMQRKIKEEDVKASNDTGLVSQKTLQQAKIDQGIMEKRSSDSSLPDYSSVPSQIEKRK